MNNMALSSTTSLRSSTNPVPPGAVPQNQSSASAAPTNTPILSVKPEELGPFSLPQPTVLQQQVSTATVPQQTSQVITLTPRKASSTAAEPPAIAYPHTATVATSAAYALTATIVSTATMDNSAASVLKQDRRVSDSREEEKEASHGDAGGFDNDSEEQHTAPEHESMAGNTAQAHQAWEKQKKDDDVSDPSKTKPLVQQSPLLTRHNTSSTDYSFAASIPKKGSIVFDSSEEENDIFDSDKERSNQNLKQQQGFVDARAIKVDATQEAQEQYSSVSDSLKDDESFSDGKVPTTSPLPQSAPPSSQVSPATVQQFTRKSRTASSTAEGYVNSLPWRTATEATFAASKLEKDSSVSFSSEEEGDVFHSEEEDDDVFDSGIFAGAKILKAEDIVVGEKVGDGAFGTVYKGHWGKETVALKQFDFEQAKKELDLSNEEVDEILQWEVAQLATVHHPNLVQFYGVCRKEGIIYLVMEYCDQGSLESVLKQGTIPSSRLWQWMLEIAEGLAYLHSQGIVHRDLKAANILIDKQGKAKLADLGVAQVDALLAPLDPIVVDKGFTDRVFVAPENFSGEDERLYRHSSKETDIYALGLVFWQMVSHGARPTSWLQLYEEDNQLRAARAGQRMPIPKGCPLAIKDLILSCWCWQAQERVTIAKGLYQLQRMGPTLHPNYALMRLLEHLEQALYSKREDARHYVPSLITERRIEGSIEQYWQRWEQRTTATTPTTITTTATTTTTTTTITTPTTTTTTTPITTTTATTPITTTSTTSLPNPPLELQTVFDAFTADPTSKTLLLLGEAGLGKTLSTYVLADRIQQQWWQYFANPTKYPKPPYFPLFIRTHVQSWNYSALKDAYANIVKRYEFPLDQAQLLVFVDGYDECRIEEAPANLADHLGLPPSAKLIVTCRPDTVPEEQWQECFGFEGQLQTCHYLSFNSQQLLTYLQEHLAWDDATYLQYQAKLQQSTDLRTVLRNPFVLYLLWQSWQTVSTKPLEQLTRSQIYAGFIEHIVNAGRSLLAEKVQQQLQANHDQLAHSFQVFANQVAFQACQSQEMTLAVAQAHKTYSPWAQLEDLVQQEAQQQFQEREDKLAQLSKEKEQKELKRRMIFTKEDFVRTQRQAAAQLTTSLPLRQRGRTWEFIHKSLFEYCSAQQLLCLLGEEVDVLSEEELKTLLKWIEKSFPEVLVFVHEHLQAAESQDKPIQKEGANTASILQRRQSNEVLFFTAIATVLQDREKYDKAREYYDKALEVEEKLSGGLEHANIANLYDAIGLVLKKHGKNQEALEFYRKALAIRERKLGTEHIDTANSYGYIGSVLRKQKQYDEALKYYRKAVIIQEKILGTKHSDTADSYDNIEKVLRKQGKSQEALEYQDKASMVRKKLQLNVAMSYDDIGWKLQQQGQLEQASDYYHKALAIRERILGIEHSDTAASYHNIEKVLNSQGKNEQALEYYRKTQVRPTTRINAMTTTSVTAATTTTATTSTTATPAPTVLQTLTTVPGGQAAPATLYVASSTTTTTTSATATTTNTTATTTASPVVAPSTPTAGTMKAPTVLSDKEKWFKAANEGDVHTLEAMLLAGAEVDQTNSKFKGFTALMRAAYNDHTTTVQVLLAAGANVNQISSHGSTALMYAAGNGHTTTMQVLLAAGANVNQTTSHGSTALMYAADNGCTNTVEALLAAGAKIDQTDSHGSTALMRAAVGGSPYTAQANVPTDSDSDSMDAAENNPTTTVQALLAAGAKVDQADNSGNTALIWAAKNGHTATVQALLKAGAKIDQTNSEGFTALIYAARHGHTETVEALLAADAKMIDQTTSYDDTALIWAAKYGHTATVQALLKAGAKIDQTNNYGETALMEVAEKGHTDTVQALLDKGTNVQLKNKRGQTALDIAMERGHTTTVQVLFAAGASGASSTALRWAARNGHIATVQALLASGAKIDQTTYKGMTALMHAAQNGHTATVQALLASGAKIDLTASDGFTALMHAAKNGHTATVQALLASGAKIDLTASDGFTALMHAAEKGHTATVQALLASEAKVDLTDSIGFTALMHAAGNGHTATVQALLAVGAKVDQQIGFNGFTALMWATINGRTATVQALLDKGANYQLKNKMGHTVLDIVLQYKRDDIAKILKEKGAKQSS